MGSRCDSTHLFYGARRVAEVAILREIDGAHTAAADAADDLVAMVENRVCFELFDRGAFAAGAAWSRVCFEMNVVRVRATE